MRQHVTILTVVFAICCTLAEADAAVQRQASDTTDQTLFVFLDCNARNCDFDHFRREITWVNWVRDREDADVHLLITAERTGSGGRYYTLDYIGRGAFGTKSLSYVSHPDATDAEVRQGLTETMALGLVQFVENTPLAPRLRVVYEAPEGAAAPHQEHDPWNLWVFEVGLSASVEGESRENSESFEGSVEADRVAEEFKINFRLSGDYQRDEFEFDDGAVIVSESEEYDADLLTVWSLGDHWSAGGAASLNKSTFLNRDLGGSLGPALEYNIFPYSESTRRQLTARYMIEAAAFRYERVTVENKTEELLARHRLFVGSVVQQPWGEIDGSLEVIQYLHDPSVHRINAFLSLEYRLFRGLELDVFARASRIKDQFFLSREGLTEEEILLRRRQRETDFRYDLNVGLSYRFGSKFSNIVNPRMSDG